MITFTIYITDKFSGKTRKYEVDATRPEDAQTRACVQYCSDTGAYWVPESYEVTTRGRK